MGRGLVIEFECTLELSALFIAESRNIFNMLRDNHDVFFLQEDSVPFSFLALPDSDTYVWSPRERILRWSR